MKLVQKLYEKVSREKGGKIVIAKFKKWIIHCINDRTDDILNQMAVDNKAFRRLTQELTPLIDAAKYNLTDEHKYLLEEMDDIRGKRDLIVYKTRCKRWYQAF